MPTDESQPLLRPAAITRTDSDKSRSSSSILPAPSMARGRRIGFQWAHKDPLPLDNDPILARLHTSNIYNHLQSLYDIARHHDNSRSVKNGYNASAAYVMQELRDRARCDLQVHHFQVPIWDQLGKPTLTAHFADNVTIDYQDSVDFWTMRYGGQSATLPNQQIVHIADHGCNSEVFEGVAGHIALIEEPVSSKACDIWDSAWNAEKAGASAIVFYNSAHRTSLLYSRVRITDWKQGDPLMTIPVVATSHSVGQTLKGSLSHMRLSLTTKTQITLENTHNIICVGRLGNDSQRIVVGAHLDSVPAGPGMVDNGSGSSSLLEMAIVLSEAHQQFLPHSKLVFAFWGAEEIGLLGSREWVRSMRRDNPNEWRKIVANINLDMLGSPNYISLVHDGEDAPLSVRTASIQIQKAFETFFKLEGLPFKLESMTAGSDFLPFLLNDVPSGGVLTGAGERKTGQERHEHGGLANAPLDPCYHQACDTLENVSREAITITSRAALFVISRLAHHSDLLSYLAGQTNLL
ncbi:unnamed protein product [Umbelopsis ramanniana]